MTTWDSQPTILTISGRVFPFLTPSADLISVVDIAHALAMTCRFAGHVRSFYSVAQHSVLVSRICAPEDSRWGLMHDAAEAYLPDCPRPIKRSLPEYRDLEARIQRAVLARFDLPQEEPESVRKADLVMLATEARDLCAKGWEWWDLPHPPLFETIEPLGPEAARLAFLERYYQLWPESNLAARGEA